MNKVQGLILLCAALTITAVGGSFTTGYQMGRSDAKRVQAMDSTFNYGTDAHVSISLPEDLQGDNVIAGTLLQIDSICTDSGCAMRTVYTSFFNGTALYGDGAEIKHPVNAPVAPHTMWDFE